MHKRIIFGVQRSIFVFFMVFIISCVPVKKLSYFNDLDELREPVVNPREQKLIMPFDKLYIKVLSIDEKTNQLFNPSDNLSFGSAAGIIGYYVDEAGNINYPIAGRIKVGGFSTVEASSRIEEALNEFVSDAAVTVKFIDNKVTILGEVQRQGVFAYNKDKLTIYEALALGGGLTRYGDRKKVILIRQEGDRIFHHILNLTDSKITSKDYYYVQTNDVIVVEPMRKVSTSYGNNIYSTILTSITTITSLIAILLFYRVGF